MENVLSSEMNENIENSSYLQTLPKAGWKKDTILSEVGNYSKYGEIIFIVAVLSIWSYS